MDSKTNTEQIRILEEKFLVPEFRKSGFEISKLLSDDFVEFGSSGTVYNKETVLKALKEDNDSPVQIKDFKTNNLSNETILATYIAVKIETSGKRRESLRSSLWKKEGNSWVIVFHQGTPLI